MLCHENGISILFIWMAISFPTNLQPPEFAPSDFDSTSSSCLFDADFNKTSYGLLNKEALIKSLMAGFSTQHKNQ
jgi:hypothetical protein